MLDIKFFGNNAFKPCELNGNYFLGYFYNFEGKLFRDEEAILHFLDLHNKNNIQEINKLSGIFTILIVEDSKLFVYSDITNYLPIFFIHINEEWKISDDWHYLLKEKGVFNINRQEEAGFLCSGFVSGNATLDDEILKTKSGQVAIIENDKLYFKTIYSFLPQFFFPNKIDDLVGHGTNIFISAGKRLINYLNGRTAVVPLSGGFDSRLILSILKLNNYEDVICFTYGKKTLEVEISKKVAEKLNYKWYFVDYEQITYDGFVQDEEFKDYAFKYANGYSMVYLQEYFALKYLQENNLIPKNSVFLPGHSGDFLGGSYVNRTVRITKHNSDIAKHIEQKYYFFKKKSKKEKRAIVKCLNNEFVNQKFVNLKIDKFYPYVEDWDVKEKLSKFIARSSYVFTYFGHEHIFYFWDKELVEFWKSMPYNFREGKFLYDKILSEKFFKPLGVYFEKAEIKTSSFFVAYQQIKDFIRYFFPWKYVLKRMQSSDWINYYALTGEMEKELVKKGLKPLRKFKTFNAVICRWYVEKLKEF